MSDHKNAEIKQFIRNLSGKAKFMISKNSRTIGLSRQSYQNKLDTIISNEYAKSEFER